MRHRTVGLLLALLSSLILSAVVASQAPAAGELVRLLHPSADGSTISFVDDGSGGDGCGAGVDLTALAGLSDASNQTTAFFYTTAGGAAASDDSFNYIGKADGTTFPEVCWLRSASGAPIDGTSVEVYAQVVSRAVAATYNPNIPVSRAQLDGAASASHSRRSLTVDSAPSVGITTPGHGHQRTGSIVVGGRVSLDATTVLVAVGVASTSADPGYGAPVAATVSNGTFTAQVTLPASGTAAIRVQAAGATSFSEDVHAVSVSTPGILSVAIAADTINPSPQDTVSFTITVTETPPALAANPDVTMDVPAHTSYQAESHSALSATFDCGTGTFGPSCPQASQTKRVRWSLTLPGTYDFTTGPLVFSVRVRVAANVPNGTPIPATASAQADGVLKGLGATAVITTPGLRVAKSAPAGPIAVGASFVYHLEVQAIAKTAAGAAVDPSVVDVLPGHITFGTPSVSVTGADPWSCAITNGRELDCSEDGATPFNDVTFPPGEKAVIEITATVSLPANPALITNTATAVSNINPAVTSPATATCLTQCPPTNHKPTASAGGPYAGTVGQPVAFAGSGTDADGDVLTFAWDFGDGSAGSGPSPSHNYSTAGVYTATLAVSDGHGGAAASTAKVTISASTTSSSTTTTTTTQPPAPTTSFFAEGSTLPGIQEYLLLANPSTSPQPATITYYFDDGSTPSSANLTVPAQGRATVDVNQTVGAGRVGVSAAVSSPGPLAAERTLYFDRTFPIGETNGSHTVVGAASPLMTWDFAEGSTLAGFQEYFTVENPSVGDATVSFTFGIEGGGVRSATLTVPTGQRRTLDANAVLGSVVGHSTHVSSNQAVLVERPMYFLRAVGDDGRLIDGGHVAYGSAPATTWSFAEGTLLPDFSTYLTLANPNATAADATITYFLTDGSTQVRMASVAGGSRLTVKVFGTPATGEPAGIGRNVSDPVGRGVAISVSASAPIVAERPIYFHHVFTTGGAEVNDGTDTPGANSTATSWVFAEGAQAPGFAPFLTILNPGASGGTATITYLPATGAAVVRTVSLAPTSRTTVQSYGSAAQGGFAQADVQYGVAVATSVPTLVEQPIYVDIAVAGIGQINGGSDVIGRAG